MTRERAKRIWTDLRMESVISILLLSGVATSALVVFAGGAIYLLHHGLELPDCRVFHGEPPDLCTVRGIVTNTLELRSRGVIELGLLLLIATPIARVAFSIFGFLQQKDYTYVVVTLIVLALLILSLSGIIG